MHFKYSPGAYGPGLVLLVTSLILGYMKANTELLTRTGQTVFTIFCFQKVFKITKLVPQCFMLPIEYLLVMFCVLKFYFVDFNGMFTYSPTRTNMASENACALQSQEKYDFSKQNITKVRATVLLTHAECGASRCTL